LDEAVSSYQKAVSIKPGFADAHYNLGNALKEQGKLDEAVSSFQKVISIRPDMAQAHSSLGDALKEQGRLDAAVSSFRTAASIRPDIAEAHSNLGNALREQGNLDEAISSYEKAISIKPDFVEAQHILNSLLGKTTRQPPRKYVETLFDEFATNFDSHVVNKLEYSTPSLLKKALVDLGLGEEPLRMVLDLGCGTGLAGAEFRDAADSLVGIDLSENMVREAEKKNIYDELHVNDIIDGLNSLESQFDLFIAADVFTYVGDLLELFKCVRRQSTKNALFIFSTEHGNCDEYVLQTTGRYAHSKDYVLSVATETGFHLEFFVQANIRKENESWIAGGIYVLKRGDTQI
jgi:predicted TPR repeat methyltransferase